MAPRKSRWCAPAPTFTVEMSSPSERHCPRRLAPTRDSVGRYRCHVLDIETLEPVMPGERGVLFVGGIGLARGYLEEEKKTKDKFLDHPTLGRVYNTGDLASMDPDGRIHYHGRIDWQDGLRCAWGSVQVRGIRIELEALEQAITALPSVKHCEARVIDDRLVT
eukprot:Skav212542  [mRNA]  locus=scaffold1851:451528:460675:+ [translate_table: standard]